MKRQKTQFEKTEQISEPVRHCRNPGIMRPGSKKH